MPVSFFVNVLVTVSKRKPSQKLFFGGGHQAERVVVSIQNDFQVYLT
jgi:hypothetical protein